MRYLTGIALPFLFQAAFTYVIIQAGMGGGAFVGLGALLFAVIGIPVTAIVNGMLSGAKPASAGNAYVLRSFLIALVLPIAQIGLLVAVSVFRL